MIEKNYTLNSEVLDNFKRNAELNAPAFVDFSDQVMHRIQQESTESLKYGVRRHTRMAFMFASIAIAIMLLSGFVYATSAGWLSIKDDSGREVLQVGSTRTIHLEQEQFLVRIQQAVKDQLQLGEAAFVLHDQADIEAIRRHELPQSYGTVRRGFTYTSMEDLSSSLLGPLSELKLPEDQVVGLKFMNMEMLPDLGTPPTDNPEKWVEATDAESGSSYAYYKFKTDEDAIQKYDTIRLNYQDGEVEYTLMVYDGRFAPNEVIKVYDGNPSAERIYEAHGIPIYHSEGDGNSFYIWLQFVGGESLIYTLLGEGEADKQLEFVKSFIKANVSDSR